MRTKLATWLVFTTILMRPWSITFSQDAVPRSDDVITEKQHFSPYAGREYPTRVFFGETHLHTAISVDAGTMCTVGQEDAYRFARGDEITTTHGLKARLSRPLDFMVLTDHAEMYGLMPALKRGDPELLKQPKGKRWYNALKSGDRDQVFATAMEIVATLSENEQPLTADKIVKDAWREYTALADRYNEPGVFTALIGYEYTTRGGYNLHRNVVFRGDASVANQTVPFSQYDSQNPEDLWRALADFEVKTGSEVLAIPHNGNLSNGRMFSVETNDGRAYTRELAELRARLEPLVEVTQIKGDSEAHPLLSPTDEFADYETWDKSNLNGSEAKKPGMIQFEYAREALKNGLVLEAQLGVNPFKFGMVGSTDSHTAMSTAAEENFFGKHSGVEPEPHRWKHVVIEAPNPDFTVMGWQQAASGYAAVWATENTREAIFDAMKRKETYATTGPRITVRFFRWMGLHEDGRPIEVASRSRLRKGRSHGERFALCFRQREPHIPSGCDERSVQRQPGPHSSNQGLARQSWQEAGKSLRRRLGGRPSARCGRQITANRQHGECQGGHVDQQHRLS